METLRRILVIITGIILIAVVIYIIGISQKAQQAREQSGPVTGNVIPEEPPATDSLMFAPDTAAQAPASKPVVPETLAWHQLPDSEKNTLKGKFPYGNPNPIFISAANRILPAVVTIQSEMLISKVPRDEQHRFFWEKEGDEGEEFFQKGTGSGIIISKDGYILTNYHVVENASEFNVVLYDKREFHGHYIGADPNTDVAVLKIEGKELPSAYLGNSDSLQIGEWVMAVGSPLTFTSTITAGIVSALGRDIQIIGERYGVENFIQTDAVINPGNSGGALVNLNGEVIGINTAIATRTGLYQGYGFAIPSNLAIKVVDDILKFGEVRRGLLGVTISAVDSRVAKGLGLDKPTGVLIQGLESGYPAERAGLQRGDVILSVNGQEVTSVNDLQIKIASKHPGDLVNLMVWRDGKKIPMQVKLGKAPVSRPKSQAPNDNGKKLFTDLGMNIRNLTADEEKTFHTENGVFVSDVKSGSPANTARIFAGDVILTFNGQELKDVNDFHQRISQLKKGDVVELLVGNMRTGTRVDQLVFVEIE